MPIAVFCGQESGVFESLELASQFIQIRVIDGKYEMPTIYIKNVPSYTITYPGHMKIGDEYYYFGSIIGQDCNFDLPGPFVFDVKSISGYKIDKCGDVMTISEDYLDVFSSIAQMLTTEQIKGLDILDIGEKARSTLLPDGSLLFSVSINGEEKKFDTLTFNGHTPKCMFTFQKTVFIIDDDDGVWSVGSDELYISGREIRSPNAIRLYRTLPLSNRVYPFRDYSGKACLQVFGALNHVVQLDECCIFASSGVFDLGMSYDVSQ